MSLAFFGWVRIRPSAVARPVEVKKTSQTAVDSLCYWQLQLDRLSEFLARPAQN
jgi:hypothetical protein